MVGWHHWLDGHGFGWTPEVGDGQGGLACCRSWGHRVGHDWATELKWTDPHSLSFACLLRIPSLFILYFLSAVNFVVVSNRMLGSSSIRGGLMVIGNECSGIWWGHYKCEATGLAKARAWTVEMDSWKENCGTEWIKLTTSVQELKLKIFNKRM